MFAQQLVDFIATFASEVALGLDFLRQLRRLRFEGREAAGIELSLVVFHRCLDQFQCRGQSSNRSASKCRARCSWAF